MQQVSGNCRALLQQKGFSCRLGYTTCSTRSCTYAEDFIFGRPHPLSVVTHTYCCYRNYFYKRGSFLTHPWQLNWLLSGRKCITWRQGDLRAEELGFVLIKVFRLTFPSVFLRTKDTMIHSLSLPWYLSTVLTSIWWWCWWWRVKECAICLRIRFCWWRRGVMTPISSASNPYYNK